MWQLSWVKFLSFLISFSNQFPSELMALATCPFVCINSCQTMTHCPCLTHCRKNDELWSILMTDEFFCICLPRPLVNNYKSFLKVKRGRNLSVMCSSCCYWELRLLCSVQRRFIKSKHAGRTWWWTRLIPAGGSLCIQGQPRLHSGTPSKSMGQSVLNFFITPSVYSETSRRGFFPPQF